MMMIGIDPGKSGAIAFNHDDSWHVTDCPTSRVKAGRGFKTVSDPAGMAAALREGLRPWAMKDDRGPRHAYVEKVHSMPRDGSASAFTFGTNYGLWLGILAACKIPYTLVTPQRWKGSILPDMTKDKDNSRMRVKQLWPDMAETVARKKDDGRAEAMLIAEYGRRDLGRTELV